MRWGGAKKRRDANEREIVKALEAVGAQVTRLSSAGAPDLLVRFRGVWTPLEVKTATGTLTPAQKTFGGFVLVRSVAEALTAIGAVK